MIGLHCDETYSSITNHDSGDDDRDNDGNEDANEDKNAASGLGSDGPIFDPITTPWPRLSLTLGGRFPFSLILPNIWGYTKVKYPPGISLGITPGICLLRAPRVMTFTLNFLEG